MAHAVSSFGAMSAQEQRQVFSRAARLLASAGDFEETLRQAIACCLPGLADFGFFDAVVDGNTVRRTVAAHEAPDIEALLAPTAWTSPPSSPALRRRCWPTPVCSRDTGRPKPPCA